MTIRDSLAASLVAASMGDYFTAACAAWEAQRFPGIDDLRREEAASRVRRFAAEALGERSLPVEDRRTLFDIVRQSREDYLAAAPWRSRLLTALHL